MKEQEFESITCSQLVEKIAEQQHRLSHKDIKLAVKHSFDYVSRALSLGDRVEIRGFGSFSLRFKKPKTMRNPLTKKFIQIPGRNIPHFKPSNMVNKRLNKELTNDTLQAQNNTDEAA